MAAEDTTGHRLERNLTLMIPCASKKRRPAVVVEGGPGFVVVVERHRKVDHLVFVARRTPSISCSNEHYAVYIPMTTTPPCR